MNNSKKYYRKLASDQSLVESGKAKIENTRLDMKGLDALLQDYSGLKPLSSVKITGCVSVTYETANLILTLKELGADLRWCPDNPGASKDDACAYLLKLGVPLYAHSKMNEDELNFAYDSALNFKDKSGNPTGPGIVIDDGCDITRFIHNKRPELLKGISAVLEQTKCGINEQKIMKKEKRLLVPIININDCFTKSLADNQYGIQQSLVAALETATNTQLRGKNVVIAGYGPVGKGCSEILSSLNANIIITEIDPFRAFEAKMKNYAVTSMEEASKIGDIFITASGCINIIDMAHFDEMKNGAILCNVGHGNSEINVKYLQDEAVQTRIINDHLKEYSLKSGKKFRLLCDGYIANMRITSGNTPSGLTVTFLNQILSCINIVSTNKKLSPGRIYKQPSSIEQKVIGYVYPEMQLSSLTPEQSKYLGN